MDLVTLFLIAFLVITFSILPGTMMAIEGDTPVKDFFIGALFIPVIGVWSSLVCFVLFNIPDSIINNGDRVWLGFFTFMFVWFGGLGLGALLAVKALCKIYK